MFSSRYLPAYTAVLLIAGCGSTSTSGTAVKSSTTTNGRSGQATASAPAASSPVPKVIGDTEEAALAVLKKAGFKVPRVMQMASNAPVGTVLSQDPAPGKMAARGSTVSLTVSG